MKDKASVIEKLIKQCKEKDIRKSSNLRFLFWADFFQIDIKELTKDSHLIFYFGVNCCHERLEIEDIQRRIMNKLKEIIQRGNGNSALYNFEVPFRKLVEKKIFTFSKDVNQIMEHAREVYLQDSCSAIFDYERFEQFIVDILLYAKDVLQIGGEVRKDASIVGAFDEMIYLVSVQYALQKEGVKFSVPNLMEVLLNRKSAKIENTEEIELLKTGIVEIIGLQDMIPKSWKIIMENWDVLRRIYQNEEMRKRFIEILQKDENLCVKDKEELLLKAEQENGKRLIENAYKYAYISNLREQAGRRYREDDWGRFRKKLNIDDALLCWDMISDDESLNKIKKYHIELLYFSVCISM